MDDFFIDKRGDDDDKESERAVCDWVKFEGSGNLPKEEEIDLPVLTNHRKTKSNKINHDYFKLDDTYLIMNYIKGNERVVSSSGASEMVEKSTITPNMEQQFTIAPIKSNRKMKLERKKLRDKTKGKKWFDIPAMEVTEEIKNDFKVLKMRGVLDRKHVYKKNDITSLPKYFQVGTVIESPADFYSGRIVKSQRKKTLVDELLADAECKAYQRRKYKEIMNSNHRKKLWKKKTSRSANINEKKK